MTIADLYSMMPLIVIAMAPVVMMIVISVLRNYEVIYGFSVLAFIVAFASLFFTGSFLPRSIESLLIVDVYSLFFLGIIIASALLVTILSHDYIGTFGGVKEEYFLALFTSTLGASLLAVAGHFVIFFLGLELLSVSLYILVAFQRSKDTSVEAGIKYLLLASVSSAFLLFGMALIYTGTGTMQFAGVASLLKGSDAMAGFVSVGFSMMMVGIGFKLALVPFHMWTPDVYQGAPAPVSAYIATVSKGAVMAVLIRFFFDIRGYDSRFFFVVISALAILSMFIGNLLALKQQNIKRLLAYSSIANMGYLLVLLLTGTDKGIQAAVFYLISYFVTTIGAFGVITLLSTSREETEKIDDYRGLFWTRPWAALVLTLSMLSLAGIPFTAGFIAKFYLILEGMKAGLMLLIIVMIINSVIGLYYYLRVITSMFTPGDDAGLPAISLNGNMALVLITLGILILGIYPGWLINIITRLVSL
ncbi:MAG TPA: NADH-quinone oxidoreductase subunit N [Bacteroidales bacterium]|nr:NADH-quinone oxidoreductase subunit N [Bacteroidales bacterium]